ncbi:hypothetical protein E2562_038975 [Oryza meyeriana var. granulata]|uniref:Uncharacterized protein n=1 Tax=Oryza meyeriana var. granulata TaxID=110450 RepID=A0A6G1FGU5_9ORYZ|nr:hypothetical protein E2562_038975 [Oryza meyeriana var. granulata]
MVEVDDGGAEVDTATACVVASSTSRSHCHHHWSAWRSRRRRSEHRPIEVRVAVTEAEDGGAEVDTSAVRLVVSSTPQMYRHLHQSVWRLRRRRSAPQQPKAVDGRGRVGEAMDGEVEAVVANRLRSRDGWSSIYSRSN